VSQIVPKPPEVADRDFRRGNRQRRRSHRRQRRIVRRILVVAAVAIPVIGVVSALSIIPALGAKSHLQHGKDILSKAQSALLNGDLPTADRDFAEAEAEFRAAAGEGNSPLMRIPALIPLIGRTPDAIRTIADIGVRLSASGGDVTRAIAKLPGGLDALAPHDGTIPIDTLSGLSPTISAARGQFEEAALEAEGLATTLVPHQVVEAGDLLRAKLGQALPIVRSADELLKALPTFAGADGPRHYFLAPQNPTELRGTGGLISSYSILTIDNGAISVSPFVDIKKLPVVAFDPSAWPSPELYDIYGTINSAGDWRTSNATPDGPTAAAFIENLWNTTQPTRIDGVILVDVQTLRYLLAATSSIHVPGVPYPLNDRNVVQFVANGAYSLIKNDTSRKDFVGVVGQLVFQQFLQQAHGSRALRALVQASADGHIVMNAVDPNVESAFTAARITGALPPTDVGDLVAVSVNNYAANKVDYFIHRTLSYDIQLGVDGTAEGTLTVSFDNTAPAHAAPSYVMGPFQGKEIRGLNLQPGEAYQRTAVFCGTGCRLLSATHDGDPFATSTYSEHGFSQVDGIMRIPAQSTYQVVYRFSLPNGWQGTNAIGFYHLSVKSQPTIVPTTASLRIHVPEGMAVSYAGTGMKVESPSQVTWSGTLTDLDTFDVRFQRGFLGRAWADVDDFLSKPVIKLGG
jgi:hypothetical protein